MIWELGNLKIFRWPAGVFRGKCVRECFRRVEGENNFLRVGMRSRRILTHFGVFLRLAALLKFSVCRSAFLMFWNVFCVFERVSGAQQAWRVPGGSGDCRLSERFRVLSVPNTVFRFG